MIAVLTGVAAVGLVLRLFGIARDVLPGTGWLVLSLAALHVVAMAKETSKLSEWRTFVGARTFEIGLAAVCVLAIAVRLPGFAADLGHAPLDIDEHRFAATVKHFFVTGELLHDTVEHYPGAVFWLFSAASFLSFLRGLTSGATTAARDLPVEAFVHASRLANIFVASATVAFTGLIARRLSGPAAGLLSATLVAIVPLSVDVTVLVRNDPGMTLVVVAATWAALVYVDSGRRSWLVMAGVLAGTAAAIVLGDVYAGASVNRGCGGHTQRPTAARVRNRRARVWPGGGGDESFHLGGFS